MDRFRQEGLTSEDAGTKLQQYGFNEIHDSSHHSALAILFRQIKKNFVVYLLLFGALVSFFVGEPITAYTITLVLFIIVILSFIQEYRAEKAIKALKSMIMQVTVVIRDGKEQEVPSRNLVPGDLVILRMGERVPADCLILEESELRVNEAILTGEAEDIKKVAVSDNDRYEDAQLVFMGSYVVNGRCQAKVLHTGMNTKFGAIASLISTTEKSLPLQDKVNKIAKYMVILAITFSLLTGLIILLRTDVWTLDTISPILILVIALSVSAFPEGFPVVLITSLAVGATRMAKQNAIVNRMSTIETLGETTVICADKTGTITTGEMTAMRVWVDGKMVDIGGVGFAVNGNFSLDGQNLEVEKNEKLMQLLRVAVLCNDSKIVRTGEGELYNVIGTPTEGALLIMAAKAKIYKEDLGGERVEEIPFNSERKMMSVLHTIEGKKMIYVKGALEIILDHCPSLSTQEKLAIEKINKELTVDAYRTVAFAYKEHPAESNNYGEDNLTFLGLVGISDPPREEVAESIELCREAGITVKMITGDNKDTALAVAKKIGLAGEVLTGDELDTLTNDELSKIIDSVVIFARVRPEHKLHIVKVLKDKGEIVIMTGDGVNDAPALKEAHIGVAMGKNGTDVSRSVADLTLKDDNFATIVSAIKEGRTVFHNIRKFVSYQLSCNIAETIILVGGVIVSPLLGWEVPILLALQILFMNLVTDDLPAITLALNHSSKDVMAHPPLRNASILNKEIFIFMILAATQIAFFTLIAFTISFNFLHQEITNARTVAMVTLILLEIVNAFNFRSFRYPVLTRSLLVNHYLFWAALISFVITLIVIYTPARFIFETTPLGIYEWIWGIVTSLVLVTIFDKLKRVRTPWERI